jgi:hypothetical protein
MPGRRVARERGQNGVISRENYGHAGRHNWGSLPHGRPPIHGAPGGFDESGARQHRRAPEGLRLR